MTSLGDVYAALPGFRAALHEQRFEAAPFDTGAMTAFSALAPGAGSQTLPAFSTPLVNVHATGVGVRMRKGEIVSGEYVLKVFVFNKLDLGTTTPHLTKQFEAIPVDVEQLPVQMALARRVSSKKPKLSDASNAGVPPNRQRRRPVVGGVSIAPQDAPFVGTLGCFVQRRVAGILQLFALSNNHVLADTNRLPPMTPIVQPGAETGSTMPGDIFAQLSEFVPIRFSTERLNRVVNRFDAAIARVSDETLVKQGSMLGIANYTPKLSTVQPGLRVIKSGRTTGVTHGTVTGVAVNGVQVNYGTQTNPIIGVFEDTIQIVGDGGAPFSMPGDSGSAILNEATGEPVALLFAGDGRTTTACNFAAVCRHFNVMPV